MQWQEAALAPLVGLVCGAIIGVERQLHGHEAGLHTNALVSLGAAAFVSVSTFFDADSGRMAAQVATGVGFLGAGLIWRRSGSLQGINTAATVWCSAAIGVAAGHGVFAVAATLAFIVLAANPLLH